MNGLRDLNLNQLILNRIKTLEEQQTPVAFQDILKVANRSEEELKAIIAELLVSKQLKEVKPQYYSVLR